ncbi:MAG: MBL fold metallo-hydrolase [Oligoflexia bacterium]|nr:MBL fold metallo-hydrolase [Oligoflexia bacterium]
MAAKRLIDIIDCDYLHPGFAGAFLLVEGPAATARAAFVETNTAHSLPKLLAALARRGLRPEQVELVIITHVHLDHAGGAAALMRACPNATLLGHPRATPHMIDPSKLVASARKVYGEEAFVKLYGEIGAIAEARVRAMQDGEELGWGGGTLKFTHVRGHANHHLVVEDSLARAVFTGDAFGLRYPALQSRGLFIFPSTSPTDFDPREAQASVRKIARSGASRAYLTHFGALEGLAEAEEQLLAHLDFSEKLLEEAVRSPFSGSELEADCERKLREYYRDFSESHGLGFGDAEWELLGLDLELNAQGIAFAAQKRRVKPA